MKNHPSNPTVKIRWLLALFIAGLVISGLTAIPLVDEVDALAAITNAERLASPTTGEAPSWALWLVRVRNALHQTAEGQPYLFYGTDWLAFGHVVIAISFIGAWRDPVRNGWLIDFGLIACALVIPWALIFGCVRGIPFWWQLIDCMFGFFGAVPLLFCKKLIHDLATKPTYQPHDRPAAAGA